MYGPFFILEESIDGIVYLDMLKNILIPHLDEGDRDGCLYF